MEERDRFDAVVGEDYNPIAETDTVSVKPDGNAVDVVGELAEIEASAPIANSQFPGPTERMPIQCLKDIQAKVSSQNTPGRKRYRSTAPGLDR